MSKSLAVTYRAMLFHFLGDAKLSKRERTVGTVLILQTQARARFWSGWRRVDWDKIALLSGYPASGCISAYGRLIKRGWLEDKTRNDGRTGYRVAPARVATAQAQQEDYRTRLAAEKSPQRTPEPA